MQGDRITVEEIKTDPIFQALIKKADEHLTAMGFTEHGFRHADLVSHIAYNVLDRLHFPRRTCELAAIAGFLHDIGNVVARDRHGPSGAALAYPILLRLGLNPDELATILGAIGNHEEEYGEAVSKVAAALILADKSDVHRTRVKTKKDAAQFDIHDRVNYAAVKSFLGVEANQKQITLDISIDVTITPVMEYFEIFLDRMVMCRRAARVLGCQFGLVINGNKLL